MPSLLSPPSTAIATHTTPSSLPHKVHSTSYPLIYHSTPSPQLRKVHSTLSCTTKAFICVYIICRLHTALRAALPPPHCLLSRTTTPSPPILSSTTPLPLLSYVRCTPLSPVPLKYSFVYILYAASSQPSSPRCRLLTRP